MNRLVERLSLVGGCLIGWSIPGFILGPNNHAYKLRWLFLSLGVLLTVPMVIKIYGIIKVLKTSNEYDG